MQKLKNNLSHENQKNEVEEAPKEMISFDDFTKNGPQDGNHTRGRKNDQDQKAFGIESGLGPRAKNHSFGDCRKLPARRSGRQKSNGLDQSSTQSHPRCRKSRNAIDGRGSRRAIDFYLPRGR